LAEKIVQVFVYRLIIRRWRQRYATVVEVHRARIRLKDDRGSLADECGSRGKSLASEGLPKLFIGHGVKAAGLPYDDFNIIAVRLVFEPLKRLTHASLADALQCNPRGLIVW